MTEEQQQKWRSAPSCYGCRQETTDNNLSRRPDDGKQVVLCNNCFSMYLDDLEEMVHGDGKTVTTCNGVDCDHTLCQILRLFPMPRARERWRLIPTVRADPATWPSCYVYICNRPNGVISIRFLDRDAFSRRI